MTAPISSTEYSECLAYQVNPRQGNNFYARIIAACPVVFTEDVPTLEVRLSPTGGYVIYVNPVFFGSLSPEMQKLVLVHEAGHMILRHIERLSRMLARVDDLEMRQVILTIGLMAMEFADNDSTVRFEKEFAGCLKKGELKGTLFPEFFGYPINKSVEQYMDLICDDLPHNVQTLKKLLQEAGDPVEEDGDEPDTGDEGESGEGGDADGGDGADADEGGSGTPGSGGDGKPGVPSDGRRRRTRKAKNDDQMGDPPANAKRVKPQRELLKTLSELFHRCTQQSHKAISDQLMGMSGDQLERLARRSKSTMQAVVNSAMKATLKSRGVIPASIEEHVKQLLREERLPWDQYLTQCLTDVVSSRTDEGMAKPDLGLLTLDEYEPYPGFELDHSFRIAWITDVSGSVSMPEYLRACAAMNSLLASDNRVELYEWQVDAALQHESRRDNLEGYSSDDEHVRKGQGGTTYAPAFRRLMRHPLDTLVMGANCVLMDEVPDRFDLLVVYTDGGVFEGDLTECLRMLVPRIPIVWLVSDKGTPHSLMTDVSPDRVVQMFSMGAD